MKKKFSLLNSHTHTERLKNIPSSFPAVLPGSRGGWALGIVNVWDDIAYISHSHTHSISHHARSHTLADRHFQRWTSACVPSHTFPAQCGRIICTHKENPHLMATSTRFITWPYKAVQFDSILDWIISVWVGKERSAAVWSICLSPQTHHTLRANH